MFPARPCTVVLLLVAASAAANEGNLEQRVDLGRKVFIRTAEPPCAICHTLADAGAVGTIGPSLDELKPDQNRVALAVRNGVGVMPPYAGKLTREQIEAVALYVSRAGGGGK